MREFVHRPFDGLRDQEDTDHSRDTQDPDIYNIKFRYGRYHRIIHSKYQQHMGGADTGEDQSQRNDDSGNQYHRVMSKTGSASDVEITGWYETDGDHQNQPDQEIDRRGYLKPRFLGLLV